MVIPGNRSERPFYDVIQYFIDKYFYVPGWIFMEKIQGNKHGEKLSGSQSNGIPGKKP